MSLVSTPQPRTGDRRSTNLRDSRLMAYLMDALERGEDIGHYGRLTFAIVARHFLPEAEMIRLLGNCPAHGTGEATVMLEDVYAHDYMPPTPETIHAWQTHQSVPICPEPDQPDRCNVYRDLLFPARVYGRLADYRIAAAAQRPHQPIENVASAITGETRG